MKLFSRRRIGPDEIQTLYRLHGPGLLLYARSLLGRKHAAEDVLQQVFMKLLQQNSIPEEPKPYLFRAVHNAALNLLRGESKHVDLDGIEPDQIESRQSERWFEASPWDASARI